MMEDRVRRLLRAGDEMQRRFVDQLVGGRVLRPKDGMEFLLNVLQGSAQMTSALVPENADGTGLQEFQNKLHGLEWFGYADTRANLDPAAPLSQWLRQTQALPPDHRPWAAEGVGYQAARRAWATGNPRGYLSGEVPAWSLIVLHTGMGMLFGERIMERVLRTSDLVDAMGRFCSMCIESARPGYEGCALEPIGLIARTLHPSRISLMDSIFAENAPDLREYLWHGIGRAIYFSPSNFLPWGNSGWRAIQMAREQTREESCRNNAVSGAAWAFTLVNLRTAEVMDNLLLEHPELVRDPAFADGVRSALTVWRELQQDDPAYERLAEILPPSLLPDESSTVPLGSVFRYRPLPGNAH